MRYYADGYSVAAALGIPSVSLIDMTGSLPAILAGESSFTVRMREHDAVYFELQGHKYYVVLAEVNWSNGEYEFVWSGASGIIGVARPTRTSWRDSSLQFNFTEVRSERGFLGLGPRWAEVRIGAPQSGMHYHP